MQHNQILEQLRKRRLASKNEKITKCVICNASYSNLWRLFTQVFSYVANRVAQRRLPQLEEEEEKDNLLSISLSTYSHVIAWAVMSDCPHTGTSLHGDYGRKYYYYSTPNSKTVLVNTNYTYNSPLSVSYGLILNQL